MSCSEPFMRAVAIADDRRLIFIAAPAAEPELHGQLPAFERLGGVEQQARRGEPATDLRVRKAEARVRRERAQVRVRAAAHTSEIQSLMRIAYAGFCLTKKNHK